MMIAIGVVLAMIALVLVARAIFADISKEEKVGWGIGAGFLFLLAILVSSTYKVDQAEEGIIMRFGKIRSVVADPGIHFKSPIDNVIKVPLSIQHFDTTYHFVNKDGLKITVDATVYYRFPSSKEKVIALYNQTRMQNIKSYIAPATEMGIKVSMNYSTEELYHPETRQKISQAAKSHVQLPVDVELVDIVIRRIGLPPQILMAITRKLEMQQEIERKKFEIQKEKMEAERKRVEADGIAKANQIIGRSLTKNYIAWYSLETLKRFADSDNNTIIVVPQNLTSLPMIIPQPQNKPQSANK